MPLPPVFSIRYNRGTLSYQTYTTDAIVAGSFDNNTADKSYLLFTRSAGMIYASAKSVREERSRQRSALQDFSHVTVSLIKGKTGWRIGSVQSYGNIFSVAQTRQSRGSVVRLLKLLRRFIQGEDPQPELFDEILFALLFVTDTNLDNRQLIEEIVQARILYLLGYISLSDELSVILNKSLNLALNEGVSDTFLPALQLATSNAQSASHL